MVKTIGFRLRFSLQPIHWCWHLQEWLGCGRLRGQLQWLCSLNRWGCCHSCHSTNGRGCLWWWNTGEILVKYGWNHGYDAYDGEIHRSTQPFPCEIVGLWLILLCLPGYHITLNRWKRLAVLNRRTQIGTSKTDSKKERGKAMKTCWFPQKLIPEVCRCHLCWSMGRRSIGEQEIHHIPQWWGIPI